MGPICEVRYFTLQPANNTLSVFTSFASAASHIWRRGVSLRLIGSRGVASLIDSLCASLIELGGAACFNSVTRSLPGRVSLRGSIELRNVDHQVTRAVASAYLHVRLAGSHSSQRGFELASR